MRIPRYFRFRDIFVDLCEKICGRAAASLFTFHYGNWLKKASYAYGIVNRGVFSITVQPRTRRCWTVGLVAGRGATRRVIDPFSAD